MKNLNVFVISSALALTISACSSGGGGGAAAPTPTVPENLSQHAVTKLPALTDTQKASVKTFFADNAVNKFPDTSLFFKTNNETDEETRLQKINALNPDQKNVFYGIVDKCQVANPATSSGQMAHEGDQATTTTNQSINGNGCPIDFSGTSVQSATLNKLDTNSGETTVSFQVAVNSVNKIIDPAFSQQVNLKNSTSHLTGNGVVHFNGSTGDQETYFAISPSTMSVTLVNDQTFTVTMSGETLIRNGQVKVYGDMSFNVQGMDIEIQMTIDGANKGILVNGEQLTDQQFKDLFGDSMGSSLLGYN
jgi:hypothetical protein